MLHGFQHLASLSALRTLALSYTNFSDLTLLLLMTELQNLSCSHTRVKDLTPLAGLTALQSLDCYRTQVADLTPLAGLVALQSLDCSGTQVTDLKPITGLTTLRSLDCFNTQVTDISPITGLTALQSLDCSHTLLTRLPSLAKLTALRNLDCSGTQITDLPPLAKLTALQSLDCSGTQITDFTPLAELTALKSLNCSYSHITDLTPLAKLTALLSLNASHTEITDITLLTGLTTLRSLDCSNTKITDFSLLNELTALQDLTCTNTEIADLTPLAELTVLQSLTCSYTQITDLTPLTGVTTLQSLDCSRTQITDLTPLVGLTKLQSLDCSHTRIKDLTLVAKLSKLQSLDCSNTDITDLTPLAELNALQNLTCTGLRVTDLTPLANLITLQNLNCAATQITDLTPLTGLAELVSLNCSDTQISHLTPLAGLTALQKLNCADLQITDLTPLTSLTALQSLICFRTQITDLAPLAGMTTLQNLTCSDTQITDLTPLAELTALQRIICFRTQVTDLAPLAQLTELQNLDCSYTQITDLKPLAGLGELRSLNCSNTQITDLKPLSGLTALWSLKCFGTQITDITPIAALTSLKNLDCSYTEITDITPIAGQAAITSLNISSTGVKDISLLSNSRRLKEISLNDCHLEIFPEELIWSKSLQSLLTCNAFIPGVPEEVLSRNQFLNSLEILRAHLDDLQDDPVVLGDVKLSVLGNGRIGKTQICNRLRGLGFEDDADSTHGIILSNAPIPDSEHTFNIWDFGGQDIYHGTHALFLKSRAIFLLVWTPETDNHETVKDAQSGMIFRNQRLSWWLDYVRRYGSGASPLIVVQNQIDQTPDNGDHSAVLEFRKEQGSSFCRTMGYSAKDRTGHPTLLDNLSQAVRRFNPPLIGRGRMKVIKHLQDLREEDSKRPRSERLWRLISFTDFIELCNRTGGIQNPSLFLQFLHNSGEIFWRRGCFGDQIILDQAWVLEAIYTVFNREKCSTVLEAQQGRFTATMLDALVWGQNGYTRNEQKLFLEFMVSSGICFSIGEKGEPQYIAPDYLPRASAQQALFDFAADAEQLLQFDSLPPLLIRNLISTVGQTAGTHAHYWRDGVVFFDTITRSRVLIEQNLVTGWRGHIRVAVANGDYSQSLRAIIEKILQQAQRLGVRPTADISEIKDTGEIMPGPDPKKPVSYYVSYAWEGSDIPSPKNQTKIVDKLCEEAAARGIYVRRDKDEIRLGGLISEYMSQLARGDKVIVILSAKYLHSRACMQELFEIWMQAKSEGKEFLERVLLFSHEDAKIWTPIDRARIAKHWTDIYEEEKEFLEYMGSSDRIGHLALKKYAAHVGDILALVADSLQPRTLEQLVDHSFG